MLNTRLVHGPSAILELHVQSVKGQKLTRDINFIRPLTQDGDGTARVRNILSCSEKTSHREIVRNSPKSCVT